MIVYTPAKINLGLHVIERRPDGFHNLETVFFPLEWKDVLEVIPRKEKGIELVSYGIPVDVDVEKHLCVKAYRLLQQAYDLQGVKVFLHKQVPLGAGLGGGSSNAAGMLKIINQLFDLKLGQTELLHYAARLGSDCSLFMFDGPTRGEGRGELLTPFVSPELQRLKKEGCQWLLIKPPYGVSTAEAYAGLTPRPSSRSPWETLLQPIQTWKQSLTNDFEPSVFMKCPEIGQLKTDLYAMGALYACMSGSGSTVFGLFPPDWKWMDQRRYPSSYLIKQLPL